MVKRMLEQNQLARRTVQRRVLTGCGNSHGTNYGSPRKMELFFV